VRREHQHPQTWTGQTKNSIAKPAIFRFDCLSICMYFIGKELDRPTHYFQVSFSCIQVSISMHIWSLFPCTWVSFCLYFTDETLDRQTRYFHVFWASVKIFVSMYIGLLYSCVSQIRNSIVPHVKSRQCVVVSCSDTAVVKYYVFAYMCVCVYIYSRGERTEIFIHKVVFDSHKFNRVNV